jgi:hypothetical protein
MGIETTTFIRKPLYVKAVRITTANFDEVATWCQGEVLQDEVPGKGTTKKYVKVRVHNPKNVRQTKAFVGDWLLYTERGYKVYTNKAFHASFDEAESTNVDHTDYPEFYIDPSNGWLTLEAPDENAEALNFDELMSILKSELSSEGRFERMEREAALGLSDADVQGVVVVSVEPVDAEPPRETIPPEAVEGKRVLSMQEQRELDMAEVRELVQSGQAVLAQDLPAA